MRTDDKFEVYLSVCMITYNHEKFITQAIESVISQSVNFNYEIIIGDDVSTDATRKILLYYKDKFPDRITLILNDSNQGAVKNLANILKTANGKYIALLEGDDYWTDNNKLQRQYDFLQSNDDCVICFHAATMVGRDGQFVGILPVDQFKKNRSTLLDLIRYDVFMPTCSVIFRSNLFLYFPDIFYELRNGCDWALSVLNAEHGLIGYIDSNMATYRSNSSDYAWSSRPLYLIMPDAIKINIAFNEYFNYRYKNIFEEKIFQYFLLMATSYARFGFLALAISSITKSLKYRINTYNFFKTLFYKIPGSYIKWGFIKLHQHISNA